MDPLTLLREFTRTGKEVKENDEYFIFDTIAIPKTAETAWRSRKGAGPYYNLEAIWLALKNLDKGYVASLKNKNFVSLADKK